VLSLVMTFAIDHGLRLDNPAARPKLLRTGPGHRPAEEHEIAAFRARWSPGTLERVAFELLLNVGQRGEDTVAMVRSHYRDGVVSAIQEKIRGRVGNARARVDVPASNDLKAILEPWLAGHGHLSILVRNGAPVKLDYFRHMMRVAYDAAELPVDFTTHGLRYTAATRLQELGVDWETIGDLVGHQTMQMVRKYVAKRRRARLAIAKLNRATRGRKENAE
jgi:integrase